MFLGFFLASHSSIGTQTMAAPSSPTIMAASASPPHREKPTTTTTKFWLWDDTNNRFPPHRMLFLIFSFLFYVVDIGLDVWVAVEYYIADREETDTNARYYLMATLFFIIFPCLILNFVSWALYSWGWLIYRNKKLHHYCCKKLEQMKYVRRGDSRNDVGAVVLVDGVHVINWARYRKPTQTSRSSTRFASQLSSPQQRGTEVIDLQDLPSSPKGVATKHKRKGSSLPIMNNGTADNDETDTGLEFYPLDLFDSCEYIAVTVIHMCLLGYFFRIIRLLYTSRRDKYSFDRYRDISFLRLIESFLESAPQLVLQLYLLVVHNEAVLWYRIVTPISIIFSIASLALAVGDYISAAKDIDHYDPHPNAEKRPRLSWPGYLTIITWHLFMIIARGLAFSLFATVYGAYVFLIVGLHYLAMVYWMYWQHAHVFKHKPEDFADQFACSPKQLSWRKCLFPCQQRLCANYGIEFIAAAFNVFFHFKIRDGGAVVTLIPFYLLSFVENAIMILLWYFGRDYSVTIWYGVPALVTVFCGFTVGLVLLVCYYLCCQPSRKKSLEPDHTLDHPTMTSTLNRMYEIKEKRGNFFRRTFSRSDY